ncbi:hypothetical protein An16g05180 [Aspergillus niger]|uniref:Uncharacterized protein n=2 Tax=Aspergillus niger TaxID=5061 RepID=A2R7Y4_ASPNC|nr:hypothetical protein An16g05180 [Aspergillus niger]CAK97372.1 hypothetical protein An16g05180 [Aspergillus niger]
MKQKRLAPDELFCPERLTLRLPNCVGSSRRTSDDLCVPIDCENELTCPHSHVDRKLKWHYHGDDSFWGSLYTGGRLGPEQDPPNAKKEVIWKGGRRKRVLEGGSKTGERIGGRGRVEGENGSGVRESKPLTNPRAAWI